MKRFGFGTVYFTVRDYLLLYSFNHSPFGLSLSELSPENEELTINGQLFKDVLCENLYAKTLSLDQDSHTAFLGWLMGIFGIHSYDFFKLYNEVICSNHALPTSDEQRNALMLMEKHLTRFMLYLNREHLPIVSEKDLNAYFKRQIEPIFFKIEHTMVLDVAEQPVLIKECRVALESTYKLVDSFGKLIIHAINGVEKREKEFPDIFELEFENKNHIQRINNTLSDLASIANDIYDQILYVGYNQKSGLTFDRYLKLFLGLFRKSDGTKFNFSSFKTYCTLDRNDKLKRK